MAAATSGAVINVLASSFLCGRNRNQALVGVNGGNRMTSSFSSRSFVVMAAQPMKSWLPGVQAGGNLVDPKWLDGSLKLIDVGLVVEGITYVLFDRFKNVENGILNELGDDRKNKFQSHSDVV